jgi:hypothetical protein
MGFMARKFRHRYISALELGFYLERSHFGGFGWKGMTFSNNRWDFYEDLTNDMARPP